MPTDLSGTQVGTPSAASDLGQSPESRASKVFSVKKGTVTTTSLTWGLNDIVHRLACGNGSRSIGLLLATELGKYLLN